MKGKGNAMKKGPNDPEQLSAAPGPDVSPTGWRMTLEVWNPQRTVARLRSGIITQREQCEALVILLAILYAGMSFRVYFLPEPFSWALLGQFVVDPLGFCGATVTAYLCNRRYDNADFAIRFVCLAVPVVTRGIILFYGILGVWLAIILVCYREAFDQFAQYTTWPEVGLLATMYVWISWRLAVYIALVAQPDAGNRARRLVFADDGELRRSTSE